MKTRRAAQVRTPEPAPERRIAEYERRLRSLDERLRLLERERQKLSAVVHHTDAGFVAFDAAARVTWANEVCARRFAEVGGVGDLLGLGCHRVLCARRESCPECPAARSLASGAVEHNEFRLQVGGQPRDFYATAMPIRSVLGGIDETIVMLQDLSDLNVLRQSEARKRAVLDTALDAILTIDADGKVAELNLAAERMFGYPRDEVVGREMATLIIPPRLRDAHRAGLARYLKTGEGRIVDRRVEMTAMRRDGAEFPVEISVTRIALAGAPVFTGYIRDLSDRKAAEAALRESEEQLRQSQKMEAVGRLAGGIAHDFNNLLTIIAGRCDLLLLRLSREDPTRKEIQDMRDAAGRAATLTHQLLAFSRRQVLAPKVLDLNAVVRDLLPMLRRLIGEDIELTTRLEPDLGRVRADPGQVEQVLMNLAVNARDAMGRGGTLAVETHNADLDETYARQHPPTRPGPYVRLTVSDTGEGMDRDTLARVFEPFFTTKEQGKGTGLGLATAYGIVKQSGGYIWVYSEMGHGSAFKVYLPRVESEAAPARPAAAAAEAPRGSETILLVEDESGVRALARDVLEARGYRVLEGRGGREALQICERYGADIHLLLTDVVMPGMSGRALAEQLVLQRPGVKVLYMSGYTEDAIARHGVLEAGLAYLQKPFTIDSLTRKVREVLDSPPGGAK
jgi:hypothetical protein